MIQLDDLKLTQSSLRLEEQVESMVAYVSSGGRFSLERIAAHNKSKKAFLIAINRFEDGELYIRDGHHRAGAIWLAGRQFLYPEEYVIESYTYDEYMEINPPSYVTPFDPRIEVRYGDFAPFRIEALRVYNEQGQAAATKYILANRHLFCCPRRRDFSIETLFRKFSKPVLV